MFERYVAIGDSSTEGLEDPDGAGGYRGWANRLAEAVAARQGRLLYANLGVRGKSARQIRDEQLAPALAMRPDLATVFAGSNDMLERGFEPGVLEADVALMQRELIAGGARVLTFTLPDLTGVMPIGRWLKARVRAMNDALRAASAATGATLVDFAAHPVGSDRRLWSPDRFHVNAEGHARIAAALGEAVGLPGSGGAWSAPLPPGGPGFLRRLGQDLLWFGHLARWLRTPQDPGRRAKRPSLTPL